MGGGWWQWPPHTHHHHHFVEKCVGGGCAQPANSQPANRNKQYTHQYTHTHQNTAAAGCCCGGVVLLFAGLQLQCKKCTWGHFLYVKWCTDICSVKRSRYLNDRVCTLSFTEVFLSKLTKTTTCKCKQIQMHAGKALQILAVFSRFPQQIAVDCIRPCGSR